MHGTESRALVRRARTGLNPFTAGWMLEFAQLVSIIQYLATQKII